MLTKDKLILDTTLLSESDNVGAYVRSSDGTLITHTTVGAKEGLDVYIVNDAAAPAFTQDASDYAEDSAHVSGNIGSFVMGVRNDANATLTSADGDYSPFAVDLAGRLKIVGTFTSNTEYAEDSAHSSGAIGDYVLSVRQDTLASSTSADGDYASFKVDGRGALWSAPIGTAADDAADSETPVKIGSRARIGALAAISTDGDRANAISDRYRRIYVNNGPNVSALNSVASVTTTAADLLAGNLSGRRRYLVQNLGNRAIFIGNDATVTDVTGFRMAAGANMDVELGEDVSLFAICTTGTQDVRILELA